MPKLVPEEVGVYLFTGFLDSGKSTFINDAIHSKELTTGEKTCILVFEEGEVEYDMTGLKNVDLKILSKEDLTLEKLESIQREFEYERYFVEYNGMWDLGQFFDAMPENWMICQLMCICDCTSILVFNANMRQLVFDKLQYADIIVFNRYKHGEDKMPYHKLVRSISRNNDIIYENEDRRIEQDDIVDPLPFDMNSNPIVIEDKDYAYFYREINEKMDSFKGKTIKFKSIMAYDASLGPTTAVCGRHIMTCCAADTQYCGLVLKHDGTRKFKTGDWYMITAIVQIVPHKIYGNKVGPVLVAKKIEPTTPLTGEDIVATFY